MINTLFYSVSKVLNIKELGAKALARIGIHIVRDLIFYLPHNYQIKNINPNLSKLNNGDLIQAEIIIAAIHIPPRKYQPIQIHVVNDTGYITLVFFQKIPAYIFNKLKIGSKHVVTGKVRIFGKQVQIPHPEFIDNKQLLLPIEPIYPLTYGIVNKQLYSYIIKGVQILSNICQSNHEDVYKKYLSELLGEIKIIHALNDDLQMMQNKFDIQNIWYKAKNRLAQKELFAHQVALHQLRKRKNDNLHKCNKIAEDIKNLVLKHLKFQLTNAQKTVIRQIEQDQIANRQMLRLLQGDVASGKTIIALITMINAVFSGYQATLMAPLDILAQQHYNFFISTLNAFNLKIALLTSNTKPKERKNIIAKLANGEIQILIGTHALFQQDVNFKNLGYVIIDEQHRFGVQQRLNLINKASKPDVLVMTATPIPRSLTLTMFGDMDVSVLDQKPKYQLPIITSIVPIVKITSVINAISRNLKESQKVYWICPLIDVNDTSLDANDTKDSKQEIVKKRNTFMNVNTRFKMLNDIFPEIVGVIHGKMNNKEKNAIMEQFKSGSIKILVATTVIEVGIDVADANLMIIENAEKFGLAQLHQLRGRVGRGMSQSYCIMIYNQNFLSNIGKQRLAIMRSTNNGFYIAEQDMKLRGSGDILGIRQSGEPQFFFVDLVKCDKDLAHINQLAQQSQDSKFINFQIQLFNANRELGIKDIC